jgi:hypothetical protein
MPVFSKSLDDVREQVVQDDTHKWDALVPCRQLLLHDGRLYFPQAQQDAGFDSGLAMSPWAVSQACAKLGIPAAYFKRCPARLQDENFNHWNRMGEIGRQLSKADADPDAAWLVRSKGGTARGVLSPRYARLDNAQLLEALFPVLSGTRYQVGLVQLSSESFHLRLVDPGICREVLPDDRLMVGVHLANSEVGLRAVTVDALVFRLVCTNGLIRRVNQKSLLKQRHIHVSEPRFRQMLEAAVSEAVVVAAGFIEQMALAIRTPVPDPEHAVKTLQQAWNLPQATADMVRFSLYGESRPETLYGLVNAVTQAAQRLGSTDERFELETLAGVLIDTTSTGAAETALRRRVLAPPKPVEMADSRQEHSALSPLAETAANTRALTLPIAV